MKISCSVVFPRLKVKPDITDKRGYVAHIHCNNNALHYQQNISINANSLTVGHQLVITTEHSNSMLWYIAINTKLITALHACKMVYLPDFSIHKHLFSSIYTRNNIPQFTQLTCSDYNHIEHTKLVEVMKQNKIRTQIQWSSNLRWHNALLIISITKISVPIKSNSSDM